MEKLLKNLMPPKGCIDVVLDTDAYNEIDDQFAICYMLASKEKLVTKAIYAAPFYNSHSLGPKDGMEKSYDEILNILSLMKIKDVDVFKGAEGYLVDEETPVKNPASLDLAQRAMQYSKEAPLYVVGIGAITNIASAILINPEIKDRIVVVWLGGHARHYHDTREFNMYQDIAAARVVMQSGVPFVQLPCMGVVSSFTVSEPELEAWFMGKSEISTFLADKVIKEVRGYTDEAVWSRCIWDVTAIAWLLNEDEKFLRSRIERICLPTYNNMYEHNQDTGFMSYVYYIKRDALMRDLVKKLTEYNG